MKKILASLLLGLSLLTAGAMAQAQAPAATDAPVATAPAIKAAPDMGTTAPAAVPASTAATPALAPVPNKGDTTWMMLSTLLVIMMTIPGLALFYGGLVRSKNMRSVLMQVMVTFSMIIVLWVLYGYSIAFTEGNAFLAALIACSCGVFGTTLRVRLPTPPRSARAS